MPETADPSNGTENSETASRLAPADRSRTSLRWPIVGGGVSALLLTVSTAVSGAQAPPVAQPVDGGPSAARSTAQDPAGEEWTAWLRLADPYVRGALDELGLGLDAMAAGDATDFYTHARASSNLWAAVPESPSPEFDADIDRISVTVANAGFFAWFDRDDRSLVAMEQALGMMEHLAGIETPGLSTSRG